MELQIVLSSKYILFSARKSSCTCSAGSWRQILTKTKLFLTYYSILSVEASFWSPPSLRGCTGICNLACAIKKLNSLKKGGSKKRGRREGKKEGSRQGD